MPREVSKAPGEALSCAVQLEQKLTSAQHSVTFSSTISIDLTQRSTAPGGRLGPWVGRLRWEERGDGRSGLTPW